MSDIRDLDILRPKTSIVKLGGEEIDVSFIPCGITFDLSELLNQIQELSPKTEAEREAFVNDAAKIKRGFDLSIDICVLFCSRNNPKLNKEFFLSHADTIQVRALVEEIKTALYKSYEAVEKYGKN